MIAYFVELVPLRVSKGSRVSLTLGSATTLLLSPSPTMMHHRTRALKLLLTENNLGSGCQRRTFCDVTLREGDNGGDGSQDDIGWPAPDAPSGSVRVFIGNSSKRPDRAGAMDPPCDSNHRYFQLAGSSYAEAEALSQQLTTKHAQALMIGDLLQRLEDPRPLLRTLRSVLQLNRHNRVFVSIFDPSLAPGEKNGEPPSAELTCIRLWTRDQAREFLGACGFEVIGERPLSESDDGEATCNYLFALSCSEQHYRDHLARLDLPPPTLEYLLFTTEHSACKVTGGIGAYVEQMERLLASERFGLCYVGDPRVLPADGTEDRSWILPSFFLDAEEWGRLAPPDVAFRLLQVLVFLYPGLKRVEFQEYLGLGHLAGVAKRSGLLPIDLLIKTRCHGSQIYLESCFSSWTSFEQLEVAYQEKVSIEQADIVSFPSRFLLDLYRSKGYRLDDSKVEIRKYPFDFSLGSRPLVYKPIDTLIFFGKRTKMKGFPLFVESLSLLLQHPLRHGIERAVIIGRVDPALEHENRYLTELKSKIELIEFEGPRAEAIALIQRYADSALCAMPYQSDNHPMAVLEAAATGCAILAANTGGIPEMIPEKFHRLFLHEPSGERLYEACVRIIELLPEERSSLTRACMAVLRETYMAVNAAHLEDRVWAPMSGHERKSRSSVGVIVPCFNSKLEHIRDLVYGLNYQTRPPDEVCFVDDGSRPEYSSELEGFLSRHLAVPFRVVRHEVNRGLASARNTGLKNLRTDYVVNIDSDDIPKADFIRDYVYYLDHDPEAVAVTSWLESFKDDTNWLDAAACSLIYKPLGDGLLLAQTRNCLGHANSAFRRDYLLSTGGWDDTDKSMWEDWALFLRIVSAGHRIGVVPKSNILYRVNNASMVRTYAAFPAMNRLARNLAGLAKFEAYRLQGLMRAYEDLRQNHESLRQTCEQLRLERSQLSIRIARRFAEDVNRRPHLKWPLKKFFLLVEAVLDRMFRRSNGPPRG